MSKHGSKLEFIAFCILIFGVIASCLIGYDYIENWAKDVGWRIIITGSIASIVSSVLFFALAELLEHVAAIRYKLCPEDKPEYLKTNEDNENNVGKSTES